MSQPVRYGCRLIPQCGTALLSALFRSFVVHLRVPRTVITRTLYVISRLTQKLMERKKTRNLRRVTQTFSFTVSSAISHSYRLCGHWRMAALCTAGPTDSSIHVTQLLLISVK